MSNIRYFCAKCRNEVTHDNLIPSPHENGDIKWYCSNCRNFFEYTFPPTTLIAEYKEMDN